MGKFLVTLSASTGAGSIVQCASTTATINGKPIAVVGDIATHPYGLDTLIEGVPTILLNNKPIVFSTAKTAMGGSVMPNTSVKISSPTFESYTGIVYSARVESQLQPFAEPKKEKELKKQIAQRHAETPQQCEEVKLTSDFAWRHMTSIAKTDGEFVFRFRMTNIFGEDVADSAISKLYDACVDKSLENPEIEVCDNTIYGLSAAYNTKTNKIYVSRAIVEEAIGDNECRHKLLAALVEEFGHHIDWLLRSKYDDNVKKDADDDEGARFAYQSFYNSYHEDSKSQSNIPFAEAQTPDGSFNLAWDIVNLHNALKEYTDGRQEGADDHVGDYEGFKIENSSNEVGKAHQNIQKQAIDDSGVEPLQNDIAIDFMFRGNWLRDFSQLLSPMLFDPCCVMNTQEDNEWMTKFNESFAPDPEKFCGLLTNIVRVLAVTKFHKGAVGGHSIERANGISPLATLNSLVDNKKHPQLSIIPGFDDMVKLSCYYEHCDNPYSKDKAAYPYKVSDRLKKVGAKDLDVATIEVDRTSGVKKYIKGDSKDKYMQTISQYTEELLQGIGNLEDRRNQVKLGGLLHIIQDFYAHSNYSETHLVKVWSDKVKTFTTADNCHDYSNKTMKWRGGNDMEKVFNAALCDNILYVKYPCKYQSTAKMGMKQDDSENHVGIKTFYTPITSGIFGYEDILFSFMDIIATTISLLDFEEKPKMNMKAGYVYPKDLYILVCCRYYDSIRDNKESKYYEKAYLKFLYLRDLWLKGKEAALGLIPDEIVPFFQYVKDGLGDLLLKDIREAIKSYKQMLKEVAVIYVFNMVKKVQLTTLNSLGNQLHMRDDNPTHTLLAKDSGKHPINSLAGRLAELSSVKIIKSLNDPTINKATVINDILIHPLLNDGLDQSVRDWARQHKNDVLKASLYSEIIDSYYAMVKMNDDVKKKLQELIITETLKNKIGELETNYDQKILPKINSIKMSYVKSSYESSDAKVFLEYVKQKYTNRRLTDEEITQIWIDSATRWSKLRYSNLLRIANGAVSMKLGGNNKS